MEGRRVNLSVRGMMVGVAITGVILCMMIRASMAFRREFMPTPAEWARDRAAGDEASASRSSDSEWSKKLLASSKRYEEMASGFDREGATWREGSYHGPYTDKLPIGQPVVLGKAVVVRIPNHPGHATGEGWVAARGLRAVVVNDFAHDPDDWFGSRSIHVRFVDDPYRGATAYVEREILRRNP